MIRLALPAGDLRGETAALLEGVGLDVAGYAAGSRAYRLAAAGREEVQVRVFRERDIPIQIALGNYDLGICGAAWVEELLRRYPSEAIVRLCDLGFGRGGLYLAVAEASDGASRAPNSGPRIASEYPNLAEAVAMALRLPAYRVLPVWGAAEAYPPEDAETALVAAPNEMAIRAWGLRSLHCLLETSAWLVANRRSLASRDLRPVLDRLLAGRPPAAEPRLGLPAGLAAQLPRPGSAAGRQTMRLALPDGHQQRHAWAALAAAGLSFAGYGEERAERRPLSPLEEVEAKVIRPQDMPQQVALSSFDLAIGGRDWLLDHLRRFPSSPVEEAADLGRGRFAIVATVHEGLPAQSLGEALACWRAEGRHVLRVASEYTNLADHYAREHRFGRYRVIPISGASEGFVPEDAEILIEGIETGRTLAANRLKAIDRLFESTTCLMVSRHLEARRREVAMGLISRLREAALSATAATAEG